MSLTHDQVKQIALDAIAMDPAMHIEDHRWTRSKREGEAELKKLRQRILASACIWAVPLILGYVGIAMWHEFTARLAALLK